MAKKTVKSVKPKKSPKKSKRLPDRSDDVRVTYGMLSKVRNELKSDFNAVNYRIDSLEKKMDSKFIALEGKMDSKFAQVDSQFAQMDSKLEKMMAAILNVGFQIEEQNRKIDLLYDNVLSSNASFKALEERVAHIEDIISTIKPTGQA